MNRTFPILGLALLLGFGSLAAPAAEQPVFKETPAQRDARMKWWREARFGMFIHWGIYAIPAGTWKGQEIKGGGEWILDRANIPLDEYVLLARQFNPRKYDPAQWVRIAKDAGMKYIVITSKHHDGFCLFDAKTTDYNVVKATPYGKDLLKPLADECRRQGLVFCTYYSIMDWHHPAQYRNSEKRYNPTKIHPERKGEYIAYMKAQLEELIDDVDPAVLWFDGEWPDWWTEEDGIDLYDYLRRLRPQMIINNRVGKGRKGMEGMSKGDRPYVGDFGTPEQQIPATGLPGVDWESCMTMNGTWGYKSFDQNWKSTETLVRNLVDIASKGGNYLLNVGPTAEGLIPEASVERLAGMGRWMKVNGESIYATEPTSLGALPWGRSTQKTIDGTSRLYLHVFDWPKDGRLIVPKLKSLVTTAYLLADPAKAPLRTESTADGLAVTVPASAPDAICSVVVLEGKAEPAGTK